MWSYTGAHKHHLSNDTQYNHQRDQPLTPHWIMSENVDLFSNSDDQRYRQEPATPAWPPVILPHDYQTDAKERADGRSHLRQVVLVEERRNAEEDTHRK